MKEVFDVGRRERRIGRGTSGLAARLHSEGVRFLGRVRPNPAILRNTCHMYLALDAVPTGRTNFDPGEDVHTFEVPWDEVQAMIADGRIDHSLVLNALDFARRVREAR